MEFDAPRPDMAVLRCPDCGATWQVEGHWFRQAQGWVWHPNNEDDAMCFFCKDIVIGIPEQWPDVPKG